MNALYPTLALFGNFGWQEIGFLAILGVLIFGRRLPEVGRSLGKSIVEFKKGLAGIEDDVHKSLDQKADTSPRIEQSDNAATPPPADNAQATPGNTTKQA